MEIAISINAVPIRLSDERWVHITEEHCELAGSKIDIIETLEHPTKVLRGNHGALIALKNFGREKWLAVVYKEIGKKDGFVITAFLTRREQNLMQRKQIWPR